MLRVILIMGIMAQSWCLSNNAASPTLGVQPSINCSLWRANTTSIQADIPGNISKATAVHENMVVNATIDNATVTFTGLKSGCLYNVSLWLNRSLDLPSSCQVATVAAPVSDVKFTSITTTDLSVSWNSAIGCVTGYNISGNGSSTASTMDNTADFNGLNPGCNFTVGITTVGHGNKSAEVLKTGATVAAPVSDVKFTSITTTDLSVSWNSAIGCVTGYNISGNGSSTASTMDNTADFNGLNPGCNFTVGITTVGHGNESAEVLKTGATVAAPVSDVKFTSITTTDLSVSWNSAIGCVTGYNISVIGSSTASTMDNTADFNGLNPGCNFTVGITTVGHGNESAEVLKTGATVAAPVSDVKFTSITTTDLSVSWNSAIGCVTGYNISGNGSSTASTMDNTADFNGLNPGCNFTVGITTVGHGNESAEVLKTGATVAAPVSDVKFTSITTTDLSVSWDSAIGCVTGYNISGNGSSTASTMDNTADFNGLNPGCNFTVGITTVGHGNKSAEVLKTGATVAAPVSDVKFTSITTTHLSVSWNSAIGCVTGYNISGNGSSTASTMDNTADFNGLNPGCNFTVGITTVGHGNESAEVLKTGATVAAPVSDVKFTSITTTDLSVSWNSAIGCVTGYNISGNGSSTASTMDNTADFNGLNPGCNFTVGITTVGHGNESAEVLKTGATVAAPVSDVKFTSITTTHLSVSWNSAIGCVTGYNISGNGSSTASTMDNTADFNGLNPGCNFTVGITTVGHGNESAEVLKTGATVAAPVSDVKFTSITTTDLSVSWNSVVGCVTGYNISGNGSSTTSTMDNTADFNGLNPGCNFTVDITTVGHGNKSADVRKTVATVASPVPEINVTAKNNTSLLVQWERAPGCVKKYKVSVNGTERWTTTTFMELSNLLPGYNYSIYVTTEGEGEDSSAKSKVANTFPDAVRSVICGYASFGYSFDLSWVSPHGEWTRVEVHVAGKSALNVFGKESRITINDVQPAQTYPIAIIVFSGELSSEPVKYSCKTDPRGVIAGSVMAVLLLALVVISILFILRHKQQLKRLFNKDPDNDKFKAIPVSKFADHFANMSCDQNRGFSEEYEGLSTVGTEQLCKAALISENKAKNRFTNVLPYDWSRVKLTMTDNNVNSDYINASYMPGYGNESCPYIAAQGPLQSTVNDFWRMIWEQAVQRVVMVTNCTEGGRVKCEQYWPLDSKPCTYGDVSVMVTSEQKESRWILRDFKVTNMATHKVRLLKHFHFIAWPDHGVPDGTSALIEFRGHVRHHIESCPSAGITLVHCSAGVGRTGTLIALDVVLQQLEKERAVGLAAFVHKMRLSRNLMVQTESQYIFLHQCILDCIKHKAQEKQEEPLYENTGMIYENVFALQKLNSASPTA